MFAARGGLVEAACWLAGIAVLAGMNPVGEHLFSLCPVSWVLEKGCPGCGLGHSIAFLFRGEWVASWEAHPMGVPALLILGGRIISLLRQYRFLKKNQLTYTYHA
ncbi:hypothetical protein OB13_13905 [Pontibacter sp. HJ8]